MNDARKKVTVKLIPRIDLKSMAGKFLFLKQKWSYLIRFSDSPTPRFHLCWFTPVSEVNLCGHATLAAAHFLFAYDLVKSDAIEFSTLSGILTAKRVSPDSSCTDTPNGFLIELDFPVVPVNEYAASAAEIPTVCKSINVSSLDEIHKMSASDDLFVVLPSGEAVVELEPNFEVIQNCPGRGIVVTGLAPTGSGFDFFSRFFCPKLGINEVICKLILNILTSILLRPFSVLEDTQI